MSISMSIYLYLCPCMSAGCGVNITNKDPTMCINDLLSRVHAQPECFTVEEFIARTVSKLEQLITEFQTLGQEAFLSQYYEYWLHR